MGLWQTYVLPRLVESACKSAEILEERKRTIPRATGRVLEIGVGSGLNLAFYDAANASAVTGIDPSPPLLARAAKRVHDATIPVTLLKASAEALPFADGAFDSVVTTYTMCSVDDPARALGEMRRVLAPGGSVYFVEHGLAREPRDRKWQARITPAWRRVGGGCRLDRDMPALFRASGFHLAELRAEYGEGARWLSFTYEGVATI